MFGDDEQFDLSNNGVDTAATSGGTDWVRIQSSNGYQCTELAHRYLTFKWSVKSVPNGDAGTWCDGTIPTGLVKATTPMHGDLIVVAPDAMSSSSFRWCFADVRRCSHLAWMWQFW